MGAESLAVWRPETVEVFRVLVRPGKQRALPSASARPYTVFIEGPLMKTNAMAQLAVRNVDDRVVRTLKLRAAKHGRSAEAEHRELLRSVLLEDGKARESFASRAARLRSRLRTEFDSTESIRTDRDRDHLP